MIDAYEQFKTDPKYHIEYRMANGTDYRLKFRREIHINYKQSGHYLQLQLSDNPSSNPSGAVQSAYHYSVDDNVAKEHGGCRTIFCNP